MHAAGKKPVKSAEQVASADANEPSANIGTLAAGVAQTATLCGWSIDFKPLPCILKSCNDPLRMLRELQALGELEVHAEGAEALEFDEFDPEECHLSWQLRVLATVSREQVEEVFAWVRDECELSIEPLDADANVFWLPQKRTC